MVIAAVVTYLPSLHGAFVFDDDRQIVANIFLQDSSYFWRAMTSDVWAFRDAPSGATSNYWRPTFVLWLMANYRLFGTESALGWHATSVLLHAAATAMAYLLLRRMRVSTLMACAMGLVFAVHPVHAESVAWISGCPDLLLTIAMFGAWMLALGARERPARWRQGAALALYALALMAKEVAVAFPLALFVSLGALDERALPARGRWLDAAKRTAPYVGLVALYFVARLLVFGTRGSSPMLFESAATAPSSTLFYLRKCVAPGIIGPSYPLRAVTPGTIGLANFWGPLTIVAVFTAFALWRGRRDPLAWIGLALAAGMLAPTMNVGAFDGDQIVHDRYLYTALLGGLMIALPALADLLGRALRKGRRAREAAVLALSVGASAPLAAHAMRASKAYESNLALWSVGVRSDPESQYAWRSLGLYLMEAGRAQEARRAMDRAIEIKPTQVALIARAELAMRGHRHDDAIEDLRDALDRFGPNISAYERIAVCLDALGRPGESAEELRKARRDIPTMKASITERMALYLERAGRLPEAAAELESVRGEARVNVDPRSRLALHRLGSLYFQMNRADDAKRVLEEFLSSAATLDDKDVQAARRSAQWMLDRIKPIGPSPQPHK